MNNAAKLSQGAKMLTNVEKSLRKVILLALLLTIITPGTSFAEVSAATNASFTNIPINLTGNDVSPLVMLNLSRDHQLSYKAYNDYSDLDGDGAPETTYNDSIVYYGYFDSAKCYSYDTSDDRFVPESLAGGANNHYCSDEWSGNFMNWATMTRMDVVRKLLYGGMRSTDTSTLTVLERQYLPTDSHSFAKYYNGSDIDQLTPFDVSEITIANATLGGSGDDRYSHTNTNPPLIRVAEGNHALWATNERWQCYWSEEKSANNGNNDPSISGIDASSSNPSRSSNALGTGFAAGDYVARVEACDSALVGQEKCRTYGSSSKPIGLLQIYGEDDQISFGLMTGTFTNNISGGVLRKNVDTFTNEINGADGTFKTSANGIVHNLNKLRIYGYDYDDGTYRGSDNCNYQQTGLVPSGGSTSFGKPANEGNCSSWGNPMSEIYLESLRYLAGKSANTDFTYGAGSKDAALGLTLATWEDPLDTTNYCAPLNILNFNASISGNDDDQMSGISDLGSTQSASEWTDQVGTIEDIDSSSWFIGSNGVDSDDDSDDLCTSKDIGNGFGSFSGLCPEGPTQKGTYLMSGTAYYANTHRIRTDLPIPSSRSNSRDLQVSSYGVALSTNVPKIEVTADDKKVTLLPAFRLQRATSGDPYGSGSLIDFKIIEKTDSYGKFYVNWEVSAMGGDHDQDVWGIIEYSVSGDNITITTNTIAQSASREQGFGYTISGTNHDGAHFHSGQNGFDFDDPTGVLGCSNCSVTDGPSSVTYEINGSSAGVLENPLWYTAKYGGFIDNNGDNIPQQEEWDDTNNSDGTTGSDGMPDNYFYATNPLQLENSLNRVFLTILQRASSGTAAAVVSNNVSGTGALYQAYYEPSRQDADNNEVSWIGTVQALWLDDYGFLREDNNENAKLDGYKTDMVIEQFYDETENKTKIRRYESTKDEEFVPYYMQGKVTSYDSTTSTVDFEVTEISGAAGSGPYSDWTVYNLTTGNNGSSSTSESLTAITDPPNTKSFEVSPDTSWFSVGDTIMVAHFESIVVPFEDVATLWNAREQLSFDDVDGSYATTQREFTFPANGGNNGGRHIKTWFDNGDGSYAGDGVVQPDEPGEFVDFDNAAIDSSNFGFLDVATETEAKDLVDYIRGLEKTGYRNRTINYDGNGDKVMRLADVVNATPTIVGAPQEAIDLLYKDSSYGEFRKQYANRRQVLYVGSNGGMLHAFNGGFYDSATKSFKVSGKEHDGTTDATEHPLGAEIWAYVPMNLLPHLKWLKDPKYSHVYYVDGKPKVFDAKIFSDDADHPNGWGTILVVGMRFGGGEMTVDTAADGLAGDTTPADNRTFSSAYIIMDITNPEEEPKLLAEIQLPDGSFSTSYPAALAVKDKDPSVSTNKWFLTFGSGPTGMDGESTKNAKIYVFDLEEIASPGSTTTHPTGCQLVSAGTSMKMLSCDTGIANSFVGDPISVDWELDYKADSIYFGTVGDNNSTSGQVMRFKIDGEADPEDWTAPETLINSSQPVVSGVTPGVDESGQKWIFFGTGRLFVSADQLSTATQSIYGVKEDEAEVAKTGLFNVSDAQVQPDGDLDGLGATLDTFDKLSTEISTNQKGWYLDLPPIEGTAGTAPASRVINASALAGGVLFSTAYQPGLDLCTGEGASRLYGLYYKTGTAYPDPAILGTYTDTDPSSEEVYSNPFIELGQGFATRPSLHTGSGSGNDAVSVFTQLSTGSTIRTEAKTVESVRSGMESWAEK